MVQECIPKKIQRQRRKKDADDATAFGHVVANEEYSRAPGIMRVYHVFSNWKNS